MSSPATIQLPELGLVLPPSSATTAAAALPLTAVQKRAQQPLLVSMWSLAALSPQLPLRWPEPPDAALPPSPKLRYRSHYRYLGPETLADGEQRRVMSDFEIALHVIDFAPLEPLLAQIYVPSHKGQVPFHPVSLFLAVSLRREERKSWRGLANLLAGAHGAEWRRLLGFAEGQTPSAAGLRRFFHLVGPAVFADLGPQMAELLQAHGLFPQHSTYPGDPPDRGLSLSEDGMLHQARSRPSCVLTTAECYQPLAAPPSAAASPAPANDPTAVAASVAVDVCSPSTAPVAAAANAPAAVEAGGVASEPTPATAPSTAPTSAPAAAVAPAGRRCRAREKKLPGCACDTPACQERCRRASRLDPEARFIRYAGNNDKHGRHKEAAAQSESAAQPKRPAKGVDVFGQRSMGDRILDDRFAVAWTVFTTLYPANTDERTIFVARLAQLGQRLPWLRLGEILSDSALGYAEPLNAIYDLGALRMVDIRAHPSDEDAAACVVRGYDGQGHPFCPHGYHLYSNGYDYDRQQAKWVCRQRCQKEPLKEGEASRPVLGCEWLGARDAVGFSRRVGRTLGADDKERLARDIPYGSDHWQARYGRRNQSESRNGQQEGLGLKRLPAYGQPRNTKEMQIGDFLGNLHTLGRLVREASDLQVKLTAAA